MNENGGELSRKPIRTVLFCLICCSVGDSSDSLVCAFATYQVKGAIRDFGKALGLPPGDIERAARGADPWFVHDVANELWTAVGKRAKSTRWQWLGWLMQEAAHLPNRRSRKNLRCVRE